MTPYTIQIDRYINGDMSEQEKKAFEEELSKNPELQKEYHIQLQVIEGAMRAGLKREIKASFKQAKKSKLIKKGLLGTVIILSIISSVLFLAKNYSNKHKSELLYDLNEQGNTNWSEADKQLQSQLFKVNPKRDTIIETRAGILFSIPAESFINKFGKSPIEPVDVEIKEAMNAFDIMKAGLSTMSNDQLLETGGMFYFNARSSNENLSINQSKSIQTAIPYNGANNNMMLFDGERKADGHINWINPKPTIRQLTTLDILKLDFYPEHFLDSLQTFGFDVKNKTLTDSIYYSYACGGYSSDTVSVQPAANTDSVRSDPEKLFKQNCSVCHTLTHQKLTAPGLAGVANRVPKGNWLKSWILNNERLIHSGDAYAKKIYQENGKAAMTVFEGQLSERDINSLVEFLKGIESFNLDEEHGSECSEISPSRIHAIWDKKFNHTILATQEFEERLKVIFKTCNARILSVYTKNLDRPLYELDSLAATLAFGKQKEKFLEFYQRRDGGVSISNQQIKDLCRYMEEKHQIYAKASEEVLMKIYSNESAKQTEAYELRNKHSEQDLKRESKIFQEELTLNLKEAYHQIGKEWCPSPPAKKTQIATINTTGWKNLDAYVTESTINRSTLNYTDPENGKRARIKYQDISLTITEKNSYDRIVSYLIPDQLSSFQKMNETSAGFNQKLNELIQYSVVTIGFKGEKIYSQVMPNGKPGTHQISLTETSADQIRQHFSLGQAASLDEEIQFQIFEQKENIRVQKFKDWEKLTQRIGHWVFPCENYDLENDAVMN